MAEPKKIVPKPEDVPEDTRRLDLENYPEAEGTMPIKPDIPDFGEWVCELGETDTCPLGNRCYVRIDGTGLPPEACLQPGNGRAGVWISKEE